MRKILPLFIFLWAGCPSPVTGKIDPYLTARTIILQANTAVVLSDGIFNQWLLGQTDPEKAHSSTLAYERIKTRVSYGLRLALDGITIAEQAQKNPDVAALMESAEKAWIDLRAFITELLKKPEDAALVSLPACPATQSPTDMAGVSSKTLPLTRSSPVDALPLKLHNS